MDNRSSKRLKVAEYYLHNDVSFRRTALEFGVAYRTVFRWVKSYKQRGEQGLLSTYRRPWNRTGLNLEEKIVLMKECEPGLTIRQARKHLEQEGTRISIKAIWGIWKRHGYAGCYRENANGNFVDCPWTKEAIEMYEAARRSFERGDVETSAETLNSIPALPRNELLLRIPDRSLNLRRRVEKAGLLFGKVPVGSYLERLSALYQECLNQDRRYSALIVGLIETMALSWNGEPFRMLKRVHELKAMLTQQGDHRSYLLSAQRLSLLISEGFAHTGLLNIDEASEIARAGRAILRRRKHVSPFFMRDLGQLYAQLEDFRETKYWYLRSMEGLTGEEEKITKSFLVDILVVKGEYKKALEVWKNEELDHWGSHSKMLRIQSMWALTKGNPHRAISLATQVLASLEKEEARGSMFGCYYTIAGAYCSLAENARAQHTLKRIVPFLTKNRLEVVKTVVDIITSQTADPTEAVPEDRRSLPTIRLILLLKGGQYAAAVKYAEKKGIAGLLHRYVFFFPQAVNSLLEKGKPTGLPRAMLNLPVFRKEIPVYSVKFLGNLVVFRNQEHLKVRLAPKDTAFLIHLATARSRRIALDRIYNNFWPDSRNPARNLAHLLVRIRKTLYLPSHFLYVRENNLCFDCHFITDHGEYLEHLGQAKAFAVAGEWDYAKTEYLHAFSLYRAAPFAKMYDDWSEEMRSTILVKLEHEVMKFTEVCTDNGDRSRAVAALERAARLR